MRNKIPKDPNTYQTTLYLTYAERAQFDQISAARSFQEPTANRRIRRPSLRALVAEAISSYLVRELASFTVSVTKTEGK